MSLLAALAGAAGASNEYLTNIHQADLQKEQIKLQAELSKKPPFEFGDLIGPEAEIAFAAKKAGAIKLAEAAYAEEDRIYFGGIPIPKRLLEGQEGASATDTKLRFLNDNWAAIAQIPDLNISGLTTAIEQELSTVTTPDPLYKNVPGSPLTFRTFDPDSYENLPQSIKAAIQAGTAFSRDQIQRDSNEWTTVNWNNPNTNKDEQILIQSGVETVGANDSRVTARISKGDSFDTITTKNNAHKNPIVDKQWIVLKKANGSMGIGAGVLNLMNSSGLPEIQKNSAILNSLIKENNRSNFESIEELDEIAGSSNVNETMHTVMNLASTINAFIEDEDTSQISKNQYVIRQIKYPGAMNDSARNSARNDLAVTVDLTRDLHDFSNLVRNEQIHVNRLGGVEDFTDKLFDEKEGILPAIQSFTTSAVEFFGAQFNSRAEVDIKDDFSTKTKLAKAMGERLQNYSDQIGEEWTNDYNNLSADKAERVEVRKRYYRKLLAVKLTYQLAAMFQGGAGGRMISDRDFQIISEALFNAPNSEAQVHAIEMLKAKIELNAYKFHVQSVYGESGKWVEIFKKGKGLFDHRYNVAINKWGNASEQNLGIGRATTNDPNARAKNLQDWLRNNNERHVSAARASEPPEEGDGNVNLIGGLGD